MIYEAEVGQSIDSAAVAAIGKGCHKLLHNERLFEIQPRLVQIASLAEYTQIPMERPAPRVAVIEEAKKSDVSESTRRRWGQKERMADAANRLLSPNERIATYLEAAGRSAVKMIGVSVSLPESEVGDVLLADSRFVQDGQGFWLLRSQAEMKEGA